MKIAPPHVSAMRVGHQYLLILEGRANRLDGRALIPIGVGDTAQAAREDAQRYVQALAEQITKLPFTDQEPI